MRTKVIIFLSLFGIYFQMIAQDGNLISGNQVIDYKLIIQDFDKGMRFENKVVNNNPELIRVNYENPSQKEKKRFKKIIKEGIDLRLFQFKNEQFPDQIKAFKRNLFQTKKTNDEITYASHEKDSQIYYIDFHFSNWYGEDYLTEVIYTIENTRSSTRKRNISYKLYDFKS